MKNFFFCTWFAVVCLIVCALAIGCVDSKKESAKTASSISSVASTNTIENVDDATHKRKCVCEGLTIVEGSRGGHYCVKTSKKGTTYKAYLPKGVVSCP